MHRSQKAFTLVELLVVVAIIALLMSMLLPALSQAKQQASRATCGANLHGVGVNLVTYASEWGEYPTPDGQNGFVSTPQWNGNGWWQFTRWFSVSGNTEASLYYMMGQDTSYVGQLSQSTTWYNQKSYMCTGRFTDPGSTSSFWSWSEREWIYGTQQYLLNWRNNGTNYTSPYFDRAFYQYISPYTVAFFVISWNDEMYACTDAAKNCYLQPNDSFSKSVPLDPPTYALQPTTSPWGDVLSVRGARYREQIRRGQVFCPVLTDFTTATQPPWVRSGYEPHGKQKFAGYQNSRAAADPEDRNYLFTDGSVESVIH